ncbi:MAG: hypothetical protein AAGE99_00235 [Chlamydiota bacterium]
MGILTIHNPQQTIAINRPEGPILTRRSRFPITETGSTFAYKAVYKKKTINERDD